MALLFMLRFFAGIMSIYMLYVLAVTRLLNHFSASTTGRRLPKTFEHTFAILRYTTVPR